MYDELWRKYQVQPRLHGMATFWNLKEIDQLMRTRGIGTQAELNRLAGLSRLTMFNVSRAGALTRLDLPTLDGIARVLGLRGAAKWQLLTVTDDE